MGAKHSLFAQARPPANILTCIEKADQYLDKNLFDGQKKGILRDNYDWLSEFSHPNFLSNQTSFALDKAGGRFLLRHGGDVQETDFQLMGYLSISSGLFPEIFDSLVQRAEASLSD
jgi:hypothetical protein